jgi:hypothetical protein
VRRSSRILFADAIDARGVDFRLVCDRDLEGIVAKWKRAPYAPTMSVAAPLCEDQEP